MHYKMLHKYLNKHMSIPVFVIEGLAMGNECA